MDHWYDESIEEDRMTFFHVLLVIIGTVGIGVGFWGRDTFRSPYDTISAISLPVSLILCLLGVLLLSVPHFFE